MITITIPAWLVYGWLGLIAILVPGALALLWYLKDRS